MEYSCTIVDTRTGFPVIDGLKPKSGPWGTILNSIGASDGMVFALRDVENVHAPSLWRDATRQWHRTLVVSFGGVAVYAGVIDGRVSWDRDAGELTVPSSEVRVLAAKRFAAMLGTYSKSGKFAPSGKSLRGLVTAVLREGYFKQVGDNWTLPFVIPADEAGSQSREWWMHKFDSIDDMLVELTDTDGGPDVALDPRWNANGHLQWHAIVGTPRVPGVMHDWNLAAEQTPVAGYREHSDGARMLTGVFALGAGSEQDTLVGLSPLTGGWDPPMPDMDGILSATSIEDQAQLTAIATGAVKAVRQPAVSHEFGLQLGDPDTPVDLSTLRLGARTRLWVPADEYVVEGFRDGYVTKLGGDVSSMALTVGVLTL